MNRRDAEGAERMKDCHSRFSIIYILSLSVIALLTGCTTPERIPSYPPMPPEQAMKVLADRSHSIHSVSAQGMVTLTRPDGESVRFDTAVVLAPPERARVRAWKFGQAVFDMTLTTEGLWLVSPQEGGHRQEIEAAGANMGRLTRQWLRLMAGIFDDAGLDVKEDGSRLSVTQPNPDGTVMHCTVDRKTLTPRQFVLNDAQGVKRFTLTLDRYAEFSGVVWPRKIEAISESGQILIEMREVELNGDLPDGAFTPPRRAQRMDQPKGRP
jgi:hypothetical protein